MQAFTGWSCVFEKEIYEKRGQAPDPLAKGVSSEFLQIPVEANVIVWERQEPDMKLFASQGYWQPTK